jgi:hypothetical protein
MIVYSGVGAHHQNGIAEQAICTVSESARAMLLHAAIHWPKEILLDLWPLAMGYDQIDPEVWIDLLQFSRLRVIDDEDENIVPNNALGDKWLSDEEPQLHQQREQLLQQNRNIPAGVPFIDPEEQ